MLLDHLVDKKQTKQTMNDWREKQKAEKNCDSRDIKLPHSRAPKKNDLMMSLRKDYVRVWLMSIGDRCEDFAERRPMCYYKDKPLVKCTYMSTCTWVIIYIVSQ